MWYFVRALYFFLYPVAPKRADVNMAVLGTQSSMLKVVDVLSYATEEALNSYSDVYLISSDGEILCANRCSLAR